MTRRLLLLSNSVNPGGGYLEHALPALRELLGGVTRLTFIPYAAVTIGYDEYAGRVGAALAPLGIGLESVHQAGDAGQAIARAEAIAVGGGNTFHLLRMLQRQKLLDPIRRRIAEGVPYIGWSAGSNLAGPTIRTTNDMPIVETDGFGALELVPFQINPHYTEEQLPHHQGETRPQRLLEFLAANPEGVVVGLREGSMLKVADRAMWLLGERPATIFRAGVPPMEQLPGARLDALLETGAAV